MADNERGGRHRARVQVRPNIKGSFTIFLTCGCTRNVKAADGIPNLGDTLYCRIHEEAATIHSTTPAYSISCLNCKHGKDFGQARLTAEIYGSKHSVRRRHAVQILRGTDVIETSGKQNQPALFEVN